MVRAFYARRRTLASAHVRDSRRSDAGKDAMQVTLEILLRPVWDEIDALGGRCLDFLRSLGLDPDAQNALAMVACELAENATKYGHFPPREKDKEVVKVALEVVPSHVTVTASNPVTQDEADSLAVLDQTIQWIRGFHDPFQAYLERLRDVSSQALSSSESRLGLVRIAYEGQSTLDFYVGPDGVLVVSATFALPATQPEGTA
jgi:hypothetical protein